MFIISILAPFLWIQPAYSASTEDPSELMEVDERFEDSMWLTGYDVDKNSVLPGESLEVILRWEILREMDRDWSVFVHLNDPDVDLPTAQRDMYPGQGLLSTRLLVPDQSLVDRYVLEIPETAVAPANLELLVGLYNFDTGERLKTATDNDAAMLAELPLHSHPGPIPNPVSVNFENTLEMVGFEAKPRRLGPSETIELSLYWRTLEPIDRDYTFFAQVVDSETTRWASHDLRQPTSQWLGEETGKVSLSLSLQDDTPSGIYPIIVGIYTRTEDGGFDRLQRVTSEGHLTDDFLELIQIRVD
jgi:hypothetical protein